MQSDQGVTYHMKIIKAERTCLTPALMPRPKCGICTDVVAAGFKVIPVFLELPIYDDNLSN